MTPVFTSIQQCQLRAGGAAFDSSGKNYVIKVAYKVITTEIYSKGLFRPLFFFVLLY